MRAFAGAAAFLLLGCDGDAHERPTTAEGPLSDLSFATEVSGNGAAVLVTVDLRLREIGLVVLDPAHRLLVSAADSPPIELAELGEGRHGALLPTAEPRVTLTFERAGDARSGEIDLPDPFALVVGGDLEPFSYLSDIPLSWEPSAELDAMSLWVSGRCVEARRRDLAVDTGEYLLQRSDIAYATGNWSSCQLAVGLERRRERRVLALGAPDSVVSASQIRTAAVEVLR